MEYRWLNSELVQPDDKRAAVVGNERIMLAV